MTGVNTANIILKRMLKYSLKFPSLRNILQFQAIICFFIKTENAITLQKTTGGYLVLKRMLELFLNTLPRKKTLEFQGWQKTAKLTKKRKTSNQKLNK